MGRELDTSKGKEGRIDEFARKGGAALATGAYAGGAIGIDGGRVDCVAGTGLALCTGDGRERAAGVTICGAAGGRAAISALVTDSDWRRICPSV